MTIFKIPMNEFLEKHGYFLEEKDQVITIIHKSTNSGCLHVLFVGLLIPCLFLALFHYAFVLALLPVCYYYFRELQKQNKYAKNTKIDLKHRQIFLCKGDKPLEYFSFGDIQSVYSKSRHMGGYASSDRDTTEEYSREIILELSNEKSLTIFSIVSDFEEPETEIESLIEWLEKVMAVKVS